jgi:cytochrome c peroxidase
MPDRHPGWFVVLCGIAIAGTASCKSKTDTDQPKGPAAAETTAPSAEPIAPPIPTPAPIPPVPQGLPDPTPAPDDNPDTADKVALGELLFFDKRLSDTGTFSCETCHVPEKGWADGEALSAKADGQTNTRHSPTLFNVAYARQWYWDGRKPTLESQILAAWTGQVGATPDKVAKTLSTIPAYVERFKRAFNEGPTADNIPKALASFVRIGIRSGNSPWDRYEKAGDESQVSAEVRDGFKVFTEKANCALCHAPPLYTDMLYHNIGVGYALSREPDPGRGQVSGQPAETGAFKTPGLRGVDLHPPYFHDGSAATLEEAVDFMLAGGHRKGNKYIDEKLKPVKLNAKDKAALIAFIKSLTPEQAPYKRPTLP